jgi:NAD(P)-dependent dehydrogenase (short-subunit alcohol dehydrogenase family)
MDDIRRNGQSGRDIDFTCTGQRALITGGGSGIGRVVAEALCQSGASVMVCDVSQAALDECANLLPEVRTILADVSDPEQVDRMFARIPELVGGLDILVNNAGIGGPVAKVEDLEPASVERIMAVNVSGMFHCTRRAVPLLRAFGGGSIINISSVAGRLGYAERSAYSASKWAVIGATKSFAAELGADNIRVNAILPGVIEGERHERLYRAKAERLGITFEQAEERFFEQVSLRRNVSARDVAAAILFLCSPAGANISGQSLGVCGDIQYMRQ